jgi:ParB/Sulfiredoxin domain
MAAQKKASRARSKIVPDELNRGTLATSEVAAMAAPYNPRRMPESELQSLRRSIRLFGFVEPVVVNRRSQRIVGGHQRVIAAAAEGVESVPVVWVDLDSPSELQLNLALNRIGGEWDEDKLRNVLAELDEFGADLALTGFDDAEIAGLLADQAAAEAAEDGGESEGVPGVGPVAPEPNECPKCGFQWSGPPTRAEREERRETVN